MNISKSKLSFLLIVAFLIGATLTGVTVRTNPQVQQLLAPTPRAITLYPESGTRDNPRVYEGGTYAKIDAVGPNWSKDSNATGDDHGLHDIIIRGCTIDYSGSGAAIDIYGHRIIVQGCELTGNGSGIGIKEEYASSHDNQFLDNTVKNFDRGIWSMSYTDSTIIQGNTIENTGHSAINCDGAGHPDTHCQVINNTIDTRGEIAIFLENCFSCTVTGNDARGADFGLFVSHYGNGSDFQADGEYRDRDANTVIENNTFEATRTCGYFRASPGYEVQGNQFICPDLASGYRAISLPSYDGYTSNNFTFTNNVVRTNRVNIGIPNGISGFVSDYNTYNTNTSFMVGSLVVSASSWPYDSHSTYGGNVPPTTTPGPPTNTPVVTVTPSKAPTNTPTVTKVPTPTPIPGWNCETIFLSDHQKIDSCWKP